MNRERLEYFRNLLLQKTEDLRKEAERAVNGMTGEKDTFPDPTDRAALETNRNFQLRIKDRERKLINKIEECLRKIDQGTFGICEECGEDISEERLLVRPFTSQCVLCKTEMEEREKRSITS